jgi:hypothetical protein
MSKRKAHKPSLLEVPKPSRREALEKKRGEALNGASRISYRSDGDWVLIREAARVCAEVAQGENMRPSKEAVMRAAGD